MRINNLKTNHVSNPIGFGYETPVFSWTTEDTQSKKKISARIEVSLSIKFSSLVYDSGFRENMSSLAFVPEMVIQPRTRYFWRVTVQGNTGDSATSDAAWFETSKIDEPWQAEWITPDWDDESRHPYIRKSFAMKDKVQSARLYTTGLGAYVFELNGKRVGNEYLAPGFIAFDMWTQYQTYDVTDLISEGENAIGAMLGNAWAKGRFMNGPIYCKRFCLLGELRITLEDGSEVIIGTDESWQAAPSPILMSEIYDGETYDANLEIADWSKPECKYTNWSKVRKYDPGTGPLKARLSLPVVKKHILRPIEVIKTPKGDTIIDVGQNITGWLSFKLNAPKGTEINLYHGEILQDGEYYRGNLGFAKCEYNYISDGTPAVCEPHFTYYGFRYVKVVGWPGEIDLNDFEACVVYSDLEATGHIETSNPLVNRLFMNATWSQRDNFLDTPTDCPQRSERMGWTGDAQIYCGTASFNMDTCAFYNKYMYDVLMEQRNKASGGKGNVPHVVPNMMGRGRAEEGSCAWADVATVIPWTTYLHYGDKTILEKQFASMCAWVDWVDSKGVDVMNGGGWLEGQHFGDWLALDNVKNPSSYAGGTENAFLAAAYYVQSTRLTAKAAKVLGRDDLVEKYNAISERVRNEMFDEYYSNNGRGTLTNQTYYLVSLFMDIVPEKFRSRITKQLLTRLQDDNLHLKTGFIGTPILCRTLSDNGLSDVAYQLLLNDDLPSWLYEVKMGATTIWERWNSVMPDGHLSTTNMNSLNHYSYGSVVEWMYRNMCGIQPCESAPGFKKVEIKPEPNKRFSFAKAEYSSASGLYRSGWKIADDGSLAFEVAVPFDADAALYLPSAKLDKVSGIGMLKASQCGENVEVILPAGDYTFTYMPEKCYTKQPMSLNSTIREILQNEAAKALLKEFNITINAMFLDSMLDRPIGSIRNHPFASRMMADANWEGFESKIGEILD